MLRFDFSDLKRWERRFADAPDQIRFAAAGALNDAVERTRERLADETWAQHVTVRDRNFIRAALTTRGERASKGRLRVVLYDQLNRGSLALHDRGGEKRPRGAALAIPSKRVRRGAKGVVASQRPRALKRVVRKGNLIFQAVGRGKNARLELMYRLQASARIKPTVPFHADFAKFMRAEMARTFPARFKKALMSRR